MVRVVVLVHALLGCVLLLTDAAIISSTSAPSSPRTKKVLHFSDVHLNISSSFRAEESAAIPYRYGQDAPLGLLESALTYAQQVLPHPDLFLYTGDHVAHGLFSDEYIAKALETNVRTIEKFYSPHDSEIHETTAIIGNADGSKCVCV